MILQLRQIFLMDACTFIFASFIASLAANSLLLLRAPVAASRPRLLFAYLVALTYPVIYPWQKTAPIWLGK
jgi:hypothetical protein